MLFNNINSYNPSIYNTLNKITLKPENVLSYLTSLKEYTIIGKGENDNIENLINSTKLNGCYINIDNLLDNDNIYSFLKKYKSINNIDYLWCFYKGFYIGNGEDLYNLINK
jgi:hypothetical protein